MCQGNYHCADNYSLFVFSSSEPTVLQRIVRENVESAKKHSSFQLLLFRKRHRVNFWRRRKEKLLAHRHTHARAHTHGRKVVANTIEGRGSERLWTCLSETKRARKRERRGDEDWVWSRKVYPPQASTNSFSYFVLTLCRHAEREREGGKVIRNRWLRSEMMVRMSRIDNFVALRRKDNRDRSIRP